MLSVRTRAGIVPNKPEIDNLGALRTHIYNYALARSLGGTFVLRFDDTNRRIHRKEWAASIERQLFLLGVFPDFCSTKKFHGTSTIQSERKEIYDRWAKRLMEAGFAYRLSGLRAIKVNVKKYLDSYEDSIGWTDLILGDLEIDISRLQDYFIFRSDGTVLYHFASVIDDHEMGITHNLRGQDKISSLAYQLILRNVLGLNHVHYGHLPLLLGEDGRRLSTRKGDPSFRQLKVEGFLEQAILSYICSSGYGDPDTSYPSLESFVAGFDINQVHRNSSQISIDRLQSINKAFIRRMEDAEFINKVKQYAPSLLPPNSPEALEHLVLVFKNRIKTLDEIRAFLETLQRPTYESIEDPQLRNTIVELLNDLASISLDDTDLLMLRPDMSKSAFCYALRWILTGKQRGVALDHLVKYFVDTRTVAERIDMARFAVGRQFS